MTADDAFSASRTTYPRGAFPADQPHRVTKKKPFPTGIFSSHKESFLSSWFVRTTALVWVVTLPLIFSEIAEGADTTVTELILDPPAAPGDPALAFVRTAGGHVILIRNQVNDVIYNNDPIPIAFVVVATDATAKTVTLRLRSDPDAPTAEFSHAPPMRSIRLNSIPPGLPGTLRPRSS